MAAVNRKMYRKIIPAVLTALIVPAAVISVSPTARTAQAEMPHSSYVYNELYRDQTSFSPEYGWNNDPNGLLYVDGTYHMYYQYNYNRADDSTENVWGHMSWGHATSTDLVHWTERSVALPAGTTGDDGKFYDMMFSGSAVYDENNTSGLFDTESGGKVVAGHGIVALLTQPDDTAGGQRQILAYSKDGGDSFSVYGEVLGADGEWSLGDNEFRDPKVFWNDDLDKWLMVVGGGAVRMFASDNLKDWEYIGDTGYWGECPDISRYTVGGETKYALIISPEDKPQSHLRNGTDRRSDYYPAEYYVIGDLNAKGLFVGETPVTRLSQGVDSYAMQTFNDAPSGKVYGISWSACWKNVSQYEHFRENYNGGMTVACELNVEKSGDSYVLTRKPVAEFNSLRGASIASFDGLLGAGADAFDGKTAVVADFDITLDFSADGDSAAKKAVIALRESEVEHTDLIYDAATETLTLNRSESSLAAKDTDLYAVSYSAEAPLEDGKIDIRILLDRGSVSVFASGGKASFFSAIFPSLNSDGISLTVDGDVNVKADVYGLNSIYPIGANDELYVSNEKINTVTGRTEYISVSSLADGFDPADVTFEVAEGDEFELLPEDFTIENHGDYATVSVGYYGYGRIIAKWNGKEKYIDFYVYDDSLTSDLTYPVKLGGESYISDDGLRLQSGMSDTFVFSHTSCVDFDYRATLIPADENAQAGALVFGVSDDYYDYYVVTVDYAQKKLKLWRAGVGDVKVTDVYFEKGSDVVLGIEMIDGNLRVYLPELGKQMTLKLDDYVGGKLGLNVYNSAMNFNDITLNDISSLPSDGCYVGDREVTGVINVTDSGAVVPQTGYTVSEDGTLEITDEYMLTLPGGKEYRFKVLTDRDTLYFTKAADFGLVKLTAAPAAVGKGITVTLDRDVKVSSVCVDDAPVEFTQDGTTVIIESRALIDIKEGEHYITVYTDSGRAEVLVTLEHEYWSGVSVGLIVTLCIVGVLIVAGGVVLFVFLYKKERGKKAAAEAESDKAGTDTEETAAEADAADTVERQAEVTEDNKPDEEAPAQEESAVREDTQEETAQ